jgi:hypothetical protein
MGRMLLVPPSKSCKNPGQSFPDWFKKQPDIGKHVYSFERERLTGPIKMLFMCLYLSVIMSLLAQLMLRGMGYIWLKKFPIVSSLWCISI